MSAIRNPRVSVFSMVLGLACVFLIAPSASAQTPTPLQSQEVNGAPGLVADVIECKREDGVLTVRVRFRNTSDKDVSLGVIKARNYDSYYVTAASKKYFILRDTEKSTLAPQVDSGGYLTATVPKGGSYVWWAKYPAPPAEIKKISYYTPLTAPFDNIPIKD